MTTRLFLAAAALALVGCNSAQPPTAAVVSRGAPQTVTLPVGSGCAAGIARYRAVLDNDLSMGHVGQSVYATIQSELGPAAAACAAGREGEALALVRSSKARHGYPG